MIHAETEHSNIEYFKFLSKEVEKLFFRLKIFFRITLFRARINRLFRVVGHSRETFEKLT